MPTVPDPDLVPFDPPDHPTIRAAFRNIIESYPRALYDERFGTMANSVLGFSVAPRPAAIDACRRGLVCLARIVRINQRPRHPTMRANLPIRTDHSLFKRDKS